MELIYIFRILYQKKLVILTCTFLAVLAAFFLTRNQQKIYKSGAQISTGYTVIQDLRLSDEVFSLPQIDAKFNNTITDFTSPKVLGLLSYNLILHDLTSPAPFRAADPGVLQRKPHLKSVDKAEAIKMFTAKSDSLQVLSPGVPKEGLLLDFLEAYQYDIGSLKKSLYVARHQRTDYIDVVFRSENPELSAYAANSIIKEFQRYHEAFRRERALESMVALDSLVKKRKLELDKKIMAKAKFIEDSLSSSLDANMVGVNILGQISQLESALSEEQGKEQDLTYQLSQIDQQLSGSNYTIPTSARTGDNSLWLNLRRQYNDLLVEYQSKGSNDNEIKKRLDELQSQMNAAAPTSISPAETQPVQNQSLLNDRRITAEGQLRSVRFKIKGYLSRLHELKSTLRNTSPASSASLDKFDKEIEFAQLEYSNTKDKLLTASNINEGLGQNFKQTLYGQPVFEPEPSKRMVVMGLSGFSALILSSLFFIFIAYIDQSIKTPSQFERQTNLKLLGTVNMINMKHANLKDQVTEIEKEDAHRNNSFRELLRKLRYEIERSGNRIILFTSTEPQQGKTTLSQALAFSLSLSKKRVLILDTNFCNNDLTVLNNAHPTLEQFSSNGHFDLSHVEQLITQTGVPNVDIIGCRGGDYTPTEILPHNHLLNFLPDLLKQYQYIFMEAAPLNGFTDTKELVRYAEGVIAIFSATAEVKQADRESIKYLQELDGKFMGAILNKVQKENMSL